MYNSSQFAESLGLQGIRVERPEDVGAALETALTSSRPVVLEAYTDPNVPTLPPHITPEQAKNYASALLKGDPEEGGIIAQSVKGTAEGLKGIVKDILPNKGK